MLALVTGRLLVKRYETVEYDDVIQCDVFKYIGRMESPLAQCHQILE